MANESVGQIALDLTVNRKGFDRSMNSITGLAKKAGVTLAAAFGTKKLIDFGKSCLELGSDLQEVQNVVDVTFPSMSKQIDKFAKNAAGQFGLSETMAKKFSGTFGSMAEAFGFSEREAYKMSTALTGLAGDVASFYNISQDEAYTKLKSVFSGETETLKDLGVVMTQNALDAYALANGYGKVVSKMTEAEKVSLRFAFVQDQLANATGDFARTSNSWANQTRILSLQFDSLKASIGQGLINVFTPVIQVVNTLLAKLQTLGNAFKNLTENIFGNAGGSNATADAAAVTSDAMATASSASGAVANNTKKAAKEAKKLQASVMGFDSLNKLNSTDSTDVDSGSSSGIGGSGGNVGLKADVDTKGIDKATSKIEKLKKAFDALKNSFMKGFKIGLGDISVLDSIKENFASIKESFLEIVSDKDVQASLGNLFLTLAESAGKVAGSLSSIALTLTDLLTGGIAKYLEQNKDRIKGYIVSMFDCGAEISRLTADFTVAIADIFTVFRSDKAKQIVADCVKVFSDAFMGVTELGARLGEDIVRTLTQPFIDNKDSIKEVLTSILVPIQTVTSSISEFVENTFDKLLETYNKYISPAFKNIANGFSTIFKSCLKGYKKYLEPVLNRISKRFSVLVKKYLNPLVNSIMEFAGKLIEAVSMLFDYLSPFIGWFINKFIARIANQLSWLWTKVEGAVSLVATLLKGVMDVLSGLIDFIVGVFTGDWEKAWTGVKDIFGAIWNTIKQLVKVAINFVKNTIVSVLTKITNATRSALDLLKLLFSKTWGKIKDICISFGNFLDGVFKTDFTKSFGAFGNVLNSFKENASNIWNSIKKIFKGINTFLSGVFTADWKKAWTGVKDILSGVFEGLVSIVKAPLNLIIGMINTMLSAIFTGVNYVIDNINKLISEVPDWVLAGFGGKKFDFHLQTIDASGMQIPLLANGGYVKANTPQLAMIGDNRHQGEVVAPEDKLQSMVDTAVRQNTDYIVSALQQIFQGQNRGGYTELVINIGNKKLMRTVLKAANDGNKRMGKSVYNV